MAPRQLRRRTGRDKDVSRLRMMDPPQTQSTFERDFRTEAVAIKGKGPVEQRQHVLN
jgi:hypothetical protein